MRATMRHLLADRLAVTVLSLVGLIGTTAIVTLTDNAEHLGSVVFVPWVALLAVQLGPAGGLGASLVALVLYLVPASANGLDVTAAYVAPRAAAFVAIGVGVGALGARLRGSERTNRTLVEGLPLATYIESLEHGLTYVGPQIESLLGYPPEAWLAGDSLWRRLLHPDDRDAAIAASAAAFEQRTPLTVEYRLTGADGRLVWVRDSSMFVEDGKRSYKQGFIVDITAQKLADEQLARSATLMRALIDTTVDGIALTDREGEILIANAPMRRHVVELGITEVGPIHERLISIAGQTAAPVRFAERMREIGDDPDTASFDEFELADRRRVFQGFTSPVVGADGEYFGRVWTLRDVTEQRELDRLRDAFVATVSHELRTPLTSISGFLELMETGPEPLGEENAGYVEVIRRNAVRLEGIVGDLLFIAQLDAGRLALERSPIDLGELARDAVAAARPAANEREVTLELVNGEPCPIVADPTRLGQVLDNLISNGIKFTPAGGTVTVVVERSKPGCLLSVSDTGIGIPAAEQPRLFERFFRSSTAATRRIPGTGLGLTIARAIVEGHDGSIAFESSEGAGTTFTVTLPSAS